MYGLSAETGSMHGLLTETWAINRDGSVLGLSTKKSMWMLTETGVNA